MRVVGVLKFVHSYEYIHADVDHEYVSPQKSALTEKISLLMSKCLPHEYISCGIAEFLPVRGFHESGRHARRQMAEEDLRDGHPDGGSQAEPISAPPEDAAVQLALAKEACCKKSSSPKAARERTTARASTRKVAASQDRPRSHDTGPEKQPPAARGDQVMGARRPLQARARAKAGLQERSLLPLV
ncbi:hypothetical protein MTO96_033573 [Rhipicephalus appendiculatus]